MLSWAAVFFVCAIVAAIFGFGDVVSASADISKLLFFLFLLLFLVHFVIGIQRRRENDTGGPA